MSDEELPPSKLGTKAHWDEVYDREVRVFSDIGDEGEVWFGESTVNKMRAWAETHLPSSPSPLRILECGSGNGTLLLSFLTSPPTSPPRKLHLTGIDYSPKAAILAHGVEIARRAEIHDQNQDEDEREISVNDVVCDWRTEDLLRHDFQGEQWDLVLDKGTFDALCLSDTTVKGDGRLPSVVYPEKVGELVKEGGYFLITSCNFTEEEIKRRWTKEKLGFVYHSSVPHKSFNFGGKTGTTVCTVAFQKVSSPSPVNGHAITNGHGNGHKQDLYICIDCGGTKTDIAIASASEGIIARATGGTSNMAEVGLILSYEMICSTVLKAVSNLTPAYKPSLPLSNGSTGMCPIHFADIWVGISGCDTPLDQKMMSGLLSTFFGVEGVAVLNDAHLLGGALLTHHCSWGIAVIAGTGSVVISLAVEDGGEVVQTGRRGGVGYLLGDDGSAFDVGRHAIRAAIDDFDAGLEVSGGLADDIRKHFDVAETGEVLAKVYDLDPNLSPSDATNLRKLRISSLARPTLDHFSNGDPLAKRAVYTAAGLLVDSIASLVSQLQRQDPDLKLEEGALIMGGGLIRQESYRGVVKGLLRDGYGVVFGTEEVTGDVAGEGVLGLVEKGRGRAGGQSTVVNGNGNGIGNGHGNGNGA